MEILTLTTLTAIFTILHFCFFNIVRYSSNYLLLLPKWTTLLRKLSFLTHYVLDWLFCFCYTGVGCYIGRCLRQTLKLESAFVSDPLGLILVTLTFNSIFYFIASLSTSSNPFILAYMQEFIMISVSDILVLVGIFCVGTFFIQLLEIPLVF